LPRPDVLFNYAGVATSLEGDARWREVDGPIGHEESPRGLRQYPLAVRATLTPDLRLTFVYSTELHREATIRARAEEVGTMVRRLLGIGPGASPSWQAPAPDHSSAPRQPVG
jgi:hypothetical protein